MSKDAEKMLQDLESMSLDDIDQTLEGLQRQVKSLTMLRKLVATRQGVEEEAPKRTATGRTHVMTVRKQIRKFLGAYGPATLEQIDKNLEYSEILILKALDCRHFTKDPAGRYKVLRNG